MKKKVIIFMLVVMAAASWGIRFYIINKNADNTVYKQYKMNEYVPVGDDYFTNAEEAMQGYEICVNSASVKDYDTFLIEYGVDPVNIPEGFDYNPSEKIYDVVITLKNTNNLDGGINFIYYILQGIDIYVDLNYSLYNLSNPKVNGEFAIALRADSQMTFHLPFNLKQNMFSKNVWNNLGGYPLNLVISQYPVKKTISLQYNRD